MYSRRLRCHSTAAQPSQNSAAVEKAHYATGGRTLPPTEPARPTADTVDHSPTPCPERYRPVMQGTRQNTPTETRISTPLLRYRRTSYCTQSIKQLSCPTENQRHRLNFAICYRDVLPCLHLALSLPLHRPNTGHVHLIHWRVPRIIAAVPATMPRDTSIAYPIDKIPGCGQEWQNKTKMHTAGGKQNQLS